VPLLTCIFLAASPACRTAHHADHPGLRLPAVDGHGRRLHRRGRGQFAAAAPKKTESETALAHPTRAAIVNDVLAADNAKLLAAADGKVTVLNFADQTKVDAKIDKASDSCPPTRLLGGDPPGRPRSCRNWSPTAAAPICGT
jgi:hypothetical protein